MTQQQRCKAEIDAVEAQLRSSHPDVSGLCMAQVDWYAELRIINSAGAAEAAIPSAMSDASRFEEHPAFSGASR